MIREAGVLDITPIIDFLRPYHGESMFGKRGRVIDEDRLLETIGGAVLQDEWIVLVSLDDIGVNGVILAQTGYTFYQDLEMDIDLFYVSPDARGTGVSRMLVEEIINVAKNKKIGIIYCGCHSNMSDGGKNNKLYTNLFKKYGFEVTGTNLHLHIGD